MSVIYQIPRLQIGDAPLGSQTDQVTLVWQTMGDISGDQYALEYRLAGRAEWQKIDAQITDIETGIGERVNHEALLDGLDYHEIYEYRLVHMPATGASTTYQAEFETRLEPGDETEFSFVAYGDSARANNIAGWHDVMNEIANSDVDFALLLGDNAYNSGTHLDFDARFTNNIPDNSAALDWNASHIEYAAYGNHDAASGGDAYLQSFALPIDENAPAGARPELNYSFDYGNVHFITIDTSLHGDDAAVDALLDYVAADMAKSDADWNIVVTHYPIAGTPDKPESPADYYYQTMVERLNELGVDLLLTGHSHSYGWTYPLTGHAGDDATFLLDEDGEFHQGDGLVQVVAGTGGTGLRPGSFDAFPFVAQGFSTTTEPAAEFGYSQIDVASDRLQVNYISAEDGRIIDGFGIIRDQVIMGTSGNDVLEGGDGDDTLIGEAGEDVFLASGGDDRIYGSNKAGITGDTNNSYSIMGSVLAGLTPNPANGGTMDGETIHATIQSDGRSASIEKLNDGTTDTLNDVNRIIAGEDDAEDDQLTIAGPLSADDLAAFSDWSGSFTNAQTGAVSEFGGDAQPSLLDVFNSGTKGEITLEGENISGDIGDIHFENFETIKFATPSTEIVCFTNGTLVETDRGERPIESLAIGDFVLTYDHGFRQIRYIYKRKMRAIGAARPVIFEAGAIGNNRPLRVSQKHRILTNGLSDYLPLPKLDASMGEALIQAVNLCNGSNIHLDLQSEFVIYYHLMFDAHELIFTHGIVSESWQPHRKNLLRDKALADELRTIFPEIENYTRKSGGCTVRREVELVFG